MSTENVYALMAGPNDAHIVDHGPIMVVMPLQLGRPGLGPDNAQQFQSGHSQNLKTNPSAEQGIGRAPGQQWAHYPHVTQPNPFRNLGVRSRDGGDGYSSEVYRPEVAAIWLQAIAAEQAAIKFQSPVTPVVNQPVSVPYVLAVHQP